MVERKESLYREIPDRDFPDMDGDREIIDDLQKNGFLLAVGSSGSPENVESRMTNDRPIDSGQEKDE